MQKEKVKKSVKIEQKPETKEEEKRPVPKSRKKKPFLPSQSSGDSDSMNQTVSNFFSKSIRDSSEEAEIGKNDDNSKF